jgi:glycosyltransferase involved in cell wall biosynthesis
MSKVVIANHFSLPTICGTTILYGEILRLARRQEPGVQIVYESYEAHASAAEFVEHVASQHGDATCVVACNAHIEVQWDYSRLLFEWCASRGIAAYVHAHDYWPHHREAVTQLVGLHARVLSATPWIAQQVTAEGFDTSVLECGIALPDTWPAVRPLSSPRVVASVARLTPRKRLPDVVRGYAMAGIEDVATLYLRVAPSQVFANDSDLEQLRAIGEEVQRGALRHVVVDQQSGERGKNDIADRSYPDYGGFSIYVCPSSYEGFGMPVVEATFYGCPALMSDIPPHRRSAGLLFGEQASQFLFPVGDHAALAELLRDEIRTDRRKTLITQGIEGLRATINAHWSLSRTVRELAALAAGR